MQIVFEYRLGAYTAVALTVALRLTKDMQVVIFTEFYFMSPQSVVQVVLSTAHPTKFSEAVTKALSTSQGFDFERDVLPQEFRGLLEKERRVVTVDVESR
jgi:threonine synthase